MLELTVAHGLRLDLLSRGIFVAPAGVIGILVSDGFCHLISSNSNYSETINGIMLVCSRSRILDGLTLVHADILSSRFKDDWFLCGCAGEVFRAQIEVYCN